MKAPLPTSPARGPCQGLAPSRVPDCCACPQSSGGGGRGNEVPSSAGGGGGGAVGPSTEGTTRATAGTAADATSLPDIFAHAGIRSYRSRYASTPSIGTNVTLSTIPSVYASKFGDPAARPWKNPAIATAPSTFTAAYTGHFRHVSRHGFAPASTRSVNTRYARDAPSNRPDATLNPPVATTWSRLAIVPAARPCAYSFTGTSAATHARAAIPGRSVSNPGRRPDRQSPSRIRNRTGARITNPITENRSARDRSRPASVYTGSATAGDPARRAFDGRFRRKKRGANRRRKFSTRRQVTAIRPRRPARGSHGLVVSGGGGGASTGSARLHRRLAAAYRFRSLSHGLYV